MAGKWRLKQAVGQDHWRRGFPGGVRTPHSHCRGPGFNPWWGTQIPQGTRCNQRKFPGGEEANELRGQSTRIVISADIENLQDYSEWF